MDRSSRNGKEDKLNISESLERFEENFRKQTEEMRRARREYYSSKGERRRDHGSIRFLRPRLMKEGFPMANENEVLTQEGREKLEEELRHLETEKRAEVGERIKVAREFGDISENSE